METAINNGGSLEWMRGRAAAKHFEFEIAPLLEGFDLAAITTAIAEAAVTEHHRLAGHQRVMMPISSGDVSCPPGGTMRITTRPARGPVLLERIVVPDELAPFFDILDIRISNRSQFVQAGVIPATMFAQNAPDPRPISYDAVQVAMDVELDVGYTGTDFAGMTFQATGIGIGTGFHRPSPYEPMTSTHAQALLGAWSQIVGSAPLGQHPVAQHPVGQPPHVGDDRMALIMRLANLERRQHGAPPMTPAQEQNLVNEWLAVSLNGVTPTG